MSNESIWLPYFLSLNYYSIKYYIKYKLIGALRQVIMYISCRDSV
ncbi:hypothetical protein HMPREF9443_01542 [Phascolarctobacterium succinatutens YIT 12067]|uniref:Uncharacterized protein n=1 Tax=Phascolarctobacterium succinatutens YIT 12067 TaxID=626939 RepID=E8LFA1_9FIRM|nr:hypothetical protein HMPREF9443_01542 [Phascolarctobacterium succinatutens YIT 12067]